MDQRLAILSVWNKERIADIGQALCEAGFGLLSTSKTAALLRDSGLSVTEISDWTGSPEILGGRVKTLHPKVAGGILSTRDDPAITTIDMVVCNLYPFKEGIGRGASEAELVELIDIGGVTLLRAAAKNYRYVTPVPGPEFYDAVIDELGRNGQTSSGLRRRLARHVFELTGQYDQVIAKHLGSRSK